MNGQQIVKVRDQLKSTRTPLEGHWNDLSQLFMPFRLSDSDIPDIPSAESVNDSTARECALILANGLASLVIPREEVWFELQPPKGMEKDDDAVRWYRNASRVTRDFIERSNFYEEVQEFLIESPVYGTAALFIGDLDEQGGLYFRQLAAKTYFIAEDAHGRVNCVVRELSMTADQAMVEFGEDKLPKHIANKIGKPEGMTEKFAFIHAVMPAMERAADDAPAKDKKPFRSYVVEVTSKDIVADAGYDEFPFAVHRYRKFGRCPWGFGPGTTGIADARQLDFLEKLADAAAEKSVFPPVVAPNSLEGEIGQGALEITYVDPNSSDAQHLKEWATAGRYDFAKDRLADKRAQLRRVFHVDLFQLFSNQAMERQPMTATQSNLVAGEKMTQFSPVFGRLVSEFLTPTLTRVFAILLRKGAYGTMPPNLLTDKGVPAPEVRYKNRIMLAMQQRSNQALMEFINLVAPIVQADPTAMDAINVATVFRDTARNAGFDEAWIRSKKEVEAMQAQRAQQQQAQQQAEMAQAVAKAGKDLGGMPPEMRENIGKVIQ